MMIAYVCRPRVSNVTNGFGCRARSVVPRTAGTLQGGVICRCSVISISQRWIGCWSGRRETTRNGKYTYVEYARFADDLVILIDAHPRHDWLLGAVEKCLREELAKLQVEINDEKSRIVDLNRGESFGFLGFDFRRIRSRRGV